MTCPCRPAAWRASRSISRNSNRRAAAIKRFADAQRAMLDRLSAGVVQFAADRTLAFCNQPFRRLFAMKSEWLADRPEFDRVLERMREANRLPEVRDFPGWKAERRDWFLEAGGAIEEQWHLPGGVHLRVVAQPLPDGGLLLIFEDRTEQIQLASARDTLLRVRTATFDNLYEALGVFAADGRLQLWNNKFRALWGFEEEFLSSHPGVDALADAAARQLAKPRRASLIGDLVRAATVERSAARRRARVCRRALLRAGCGAAAGRQRAVHDARRDGQPPDGARAARPQRGAGGGGPDQDGVRRQYELRAAHADHLDQRLRRDAVREAMPAS